MTPGPGWRYPAASMFSSSVWTLPTDMLTAAPRMVEAAVNGWT